MQGEKQLLPLQEMMKKYKRNPEYALTLSPLLLKKKSFAKLSVKYLLLLEESSLLLQLRDEEKFVAHVHLENVGDTQRIVIYSLTHKPILTYNSKKYEILIPLLENVQSRKIATGHKIEIPSLELRNIILLKDGKTAAKGKLVTVEKQLAIEITEVKTNG